jgi:dipeptidyl aminopeptidase/acylaminoacyl peptidase
VIHRRNLLAAGVGAPLAALIPAAAIAAAQPPSLDELLGPADTLDVDLSPDGKRLAILRQQVDGDKRKAFVLISKVDDITATPSAVALGEKHVNAVKWANNGRLLIWLSFWADENGHPNGYLIGDIFIPVPVKRVLSIGADGRDPIVLFGQQKSMIARSFDTSTVVDFLVDEPGHVLMQVWDFSRNAFGLYKVDVATGAADLVERGSRDTDFWMTQRGVPVLRMDTNSRRTVGSVFGRAPGETEWKLVRKARLDELRKLPDFEIVGVTPEAGVFLVSAHGEGDDTSVIRRFDLKTMQFGDTVAQQRGHDMVGAFVDQRGALVASGYIADRLDYQFADPSLAAHFRAVNSYFHNECNVEIVNVDDGHKRFIFRVSGPRDPGSFHVYHRDGAKLEQIGVQQPALTADRLAPMEALRVKTRDGDEITAYLSSPIGHPTDQPLPLVVYPHGGPEDRDTLDFDLFVQAFAARGWRVLQPNFRGSGGYGRAFADKGRRRWADRMQEDIEDAVAQVVAAGRADPAHIAICGASYGGYAALMGAVRQPRQYKAAVSIAGVSDLIEMMAFVRHEDGADSPIYAYWLASIGDPKADEAALVTGSPRRRVKEIQAPILLMHGTEDTIVDPNQSKIMAKALKDAGKPYDYLELKGENHRGWSHDTTKTVIATAADFIAKHI